jgi:hypothetical protein
MGQYIFEGKYQNKSASVKVKLLLECQLRNYQTFP